VSEAVVTDEVLCNRLTIVDQEGRIRIRLSVSGERAEVVLNGEEGSMIALNAGPDLGEDEPGLGLYIGTRTSSCDVTTSGITTWARSDNDERIRAMEERIANVHRILEALPPMLRGEAEG
jgi:hypothetical protein